MQKNWLNCKQRTYIEEQKKNCLTTQSNLLIANFTAKVNELKTSKKKQAQKRTS